MHVHVDFRRACKVFDILIEALRHRRHPFDAPPSDDAPRKYGSRRFKALYWFHACYYMRARMLSEQGLRGLAQLFAEHREMFDPRMARHLTPGTVTRRLQDYGLGFKAEEIGRTWVINAERLHQRYGGNPLRIFHGAATYEQVCERTCNNFRGQGFYGFQEKVTSLLIIFLIEAGLIEPFMFPAPTDIHAMRVLMIHGILVPADLQ